MLSTPRHGRNRQIHLCCRDGAGRAVKRMSSSGSPRLQGRSPVDDLPGCLQACPLAARGAYYIGRLPLPCTYRNEFSLYKMGRA